MRPSRSTSVSELLAAAWCLAAFLTLLTADEVRTWLARDEVVGDSAAVARVGPWLEELSQAVGLAALRERLAAVRGALHGHPPAPPARVAGTAPPPPAAAGAALALPGQHVVAPRATRVLLIGASSMQFGFGPELEAALGRYEGVTVFRFARSATGLSRPDELDWLAKLDELATKHRPDLVIGNFGGNDAQAIYVSPREHIEYGSAAWDAAYRERVAAMVRRAAAYGAHMVMIGMPVMRQKTFDGRIRHLNALMRDATEAAGGDYIEQYDLASAADGSYKAEVVVGGRRHLMRTADGIHYTSWGGRHVAEGVLARLERRVRLIPRDPTRGVVEEHRFFSPALGRSTSYLAWRPRSGAAGLPWLVFLHGAGASPDDVAEQLGPSLLRLVEAYQLTVVCPEAGRDSWYVDTATEKTATFVSADLVNDVTAHLGVGARRSIAGISMGGHGALDIALRDPGFVAASALSGVVDITRAGDRPALVARLGPLHEDPARWEAWSVLHQVRARPERARALPILLSVGAEDRWAPANRELRALLDALGGAIHEYDEGAGGHTWSYWAQILPRHVAWHAARLAVAPR